MTDSVLKAMYEAAVLDEFLVADRDAGYMEAAGRPLVNDHASLQAGQD